MAGLRFAFVSCRCGLHCAVSMDTLGKSAAANDPTVLPAQPNGTPSLSGGAVGISNGPRRSDGGVSLGLFSKIAASRKQQLSSSIGPLKDGAHSGSMRSLTGVMDNSAGSGAATGSPARDARLAPQAATATTTTTTTLPTTKNTSHFPEIHDPASHWSRASATTRAPLNPRKVTSRNFAQNLRWTKQGFADDARGTSAGAMGTASSIASPGNTTTAGATRGGAYGAGPRRSSPAISPVARNVHPERLQQQRQQLPQRRSIFDLVPFRPACAFVEPVMRC